MTDQLEFPRVLVVAAEPIGPPKNTGITVASMFSEWPADRLAQISLVQATSRSTLCIHHYPESHVLLAARLRKVIDRRRPLSTEGRQSSPEAPPVGINRPSWQSAWADSLPLRSTTALDSFVAGFDPDIVYTPLGFNRVLAIVNRISRVQQIPVVPHFMDDWLPNTYTNRASLVPRRLLEKRLRTTMSAAPVGLAISEEMAHEYSEHYEVPFHPMGNIVDIPPETAPKLGSDVISLGYVGGLHLQRWEMLLDVGRAVERQGGRFRLSIHCPESDRHLFSPRFSALRHTVFEGSLDAEQVPAALVDHHALVHVESADRSTRNFTRLSLSTKIPQYLAAGRPILSYAPTELASVKHLGRSQSAIISAAGELNSLEAAIVKLDDDSVRHTLGQHGRAFALKHHERTSQAVLLHSLLKTATASPGRHTRP